MNRQRAMFPVEPSPFVDTCRIAVCGTPDRPGCGRDILWATTMQGARIPVDPQPVPNGSLIFVDTCRVDVLRADERTSCTLPRYMPHHATCEFAANFRGPRR